jgi:hypothetical protein
MRTGMGIDGTPTGIEKRGILQDPYRLTYGIDTMLSLSKGMSADLKAFPEIFQVSFFFRCFEPSFDDIAATSVYSDGKGFPHDPFSNDRSCF